MKIIRIVVKDNSKSQLVSTPTDQPLGCGQCQMYN